MSQPLLTDWKEVLCAFHRPLTFQAHCDGNIFIYWVGEVVLRSLLKTFQNSGSPKLLLYIWLTVVKANFSHWPTAAIANGTKHRISFLSGVSLGLNVLTPGSINHELHSILCTPFPLATISLSGITALHLRPSSWHQTWSPQLEALHPSSEILQNLVSASCCL